VPAVANFFSGTFECKPIVVLLDEEGRFEEDLVEGD
jgi:hypothetical protein